MVVHETYVSWALGAVSWFIGLMDFAIVAILPLFEVFPNFVRCNYPMCGKGHISASSETNDEAEPHYYPKKS